jgi:tetratricopeptide (TPR) repeat protein
MNKKNKVILLIFMIVVLFSCKMDKEKQMEIFLRALEKAQENDYKAALEILEKNIKKRDRSYHYYFYHGSFIESQNYIKYSPLALEDYYKAYEINPNTFDINLFIGSAYVRIEEYDRAIPFLEKAYELYSPESDTPPPYWGLAEAYRHVGRLEDALEMNAKAIEESDYSWQYLQRGIILSQISGDIRALTENYEIANKIELNLHNNRGYALRLIQMGYIENAYQLYNNWLIGNEKIYDWCYADMGYILMTKGDWKNSINLLKKAEAINNRDIFTLKYLSFYYFFCDDYNQAYSYEAQVRLEKEPIGVTYWKKSINEFLDGYKNDWQFQKLGMHG